jgi:hypothetical protein
VWALLVSFFLILFHVRARVGRSPSVGAGRAACRGWSRRPRGRPRRPSRQAAPPAARSHGRARALTMLTHGWRRISRSCGRRQGPHPTAQVAPPRPAKKALDGGVRDMSTHGSPPTRVPEVPVKWTRPARSPARPTSRPGDLTHNPGNLGRLQKTLSKSRRIRRACGARLFPRSRLDAASRSADLGFTL